MREGVESGQCGRLGFGGATAADGRDVMVEGPSGILAISPNRWRPAYEPSKRRLTWPNGAIGTLYSAEEPDRLRGPQHDRFWADELAAWQQLQEAWDMIEFGLRVGANPQVIATSTPRGLAFLRKLEAEPTTVTTRGSTWENSDNLAPPFLDAIRKKYEGTRLGRQEIDAEILDDNPGALWKLILIDAARVDHCPQLSRIVVAWDPATTADATSDEHGLLVVGAGACSCKGKPDLHGFVLEDDSAILTPRESCDRVVSAYERRKANTVIGETNQGGDFIEALLRSTDEGKRLAYRGVHAKDGKRLRAEPVASLYEQGLVHHVGSFPKLEDEMCLAPGTMILAKRGHVPIESVQSGDVVLTRNGWRRVTWAGRTGRASLWRLRASNGSTLHASARHPIWTEAGGFIRLPKISNGDILLLCPTCAIHSWNSTAGDISETSVMDITRAAGRAGSPNCCILRYGPPPTAPSHQGTSFTTSTAIEETTFCPICNLSRAPSTGRFTGHRDATHGIGELGQGGEQQNGGKDNRGSWLAKDAETNSGQLAFGHPSVVDIVETGSGELSDVYNLSVDGEPEFFANGLLVHNCTWDPLNQIESPNRVDALVHGLTDLLVHAAPPSYRATSGLYKPRR